MVLGTVTCRPPGGDNIDFFLSFTRHDTRGDRWYGLPLWLSPDQSHLAMFSMTERSTGEVFTATKNQSAGFLGCRCRHAPALRAPRLLGGAVGRQRLLRHGPGQWQRAAPNNDSTKTCCDLRGRRLRGHRFRPALRLFLHPHARPRCSGRRWSQHAGIWCRVVRSLHWAPALDAPSVLGLGIAAVE